MWHTKNAFFRKMQFWSHCYTVVSYQALFRLSVYKISAVYLSGAKMCVFARYATLVPRLVGTHWNLYLQHMLLKIRKRTIWKFTCSKSHVRCLVCEKGIKCSTSIAFYLFSPTRLINSIKYEHSCKILYLLYVYETYTHSGSVIKLTSSAVTRKEVFALEQICFDTLCALLLNYAKTLFYCFQAL